MDCVINTQMLSRTLSTLCRAVNRSWLDFISFESSFSHSNSLWSQFGDKLFPQPGSHPVIAGFPNHDICEDKYVSNLYELLNEYILRAVPKSKVRSYATGIT